MSTMATLAVGDRLDAISDYSASRKKPRVDVLITLRKCEL